MKSIAITGLIGSGKSQVRKIVSLTYPVLDCDQIARDLMQENQEGYLAAKEQFQAFLTERRFDRQALADYIFTHPAKRRQLEAILHPLVLKTVRQQLNNLADQAFVFVEVPLLFEVGWQDYFDYSLLVVSQPEKLFQRLINDRKLTREQIQQIIDQQMPAEEKSALADYVIINDGTLAELTEQVELFIRKLQENRL
ncbi:MAG: dephospho-CoA kinase [Erysipelotrichaceae bacterium]|nr:dephospho-CoA kinase [Erysipelotrichaceae bacterium]